MKIRKILFLPLVLVILTGCLNYTQITTLKIDGSGKMFVHYWMKLRSDEDTLIINRLKIFNADSIRQQFSSKFCEIIFVESYIDNSDSTIHSKIEFLFDSVDSLNLIKPLKDSNFSIKDGPDDTKIFTQFIPSIATGFGFGGESFRVTYVYYLPGDVIRHNASSKNRNMLTWTYNIEEIGSGKNIHAVYRPFRLKETPLLIYILASLVIIVVIVYLFGKRKT